MDGVYQKRAGIKVTLYTHPLSEDGWHMHQDWMQFYHDQFGEASFKICLSEPGPSLKGETKLKSIPQICLALKAASLQTAPAAIIYFDAIQQAIWADGQDFSDVSELFSIGRRISRQYHSIFDFCRFASDFTSKQACKSLHDDFRKCSINRIKVFPTITITSESKGIKLEGSKTYGQLVASLAKFCPKASHYSNTSK